MYKQDIVHNFVRLVMLFQELFQIISVDNELRDGRWVDVEHIRFDVLEVLVKMLYRLILPKRIVDSH